MVRATRLEQDTSPALPDHDGQGALWRLCQVAWLLSDVATTSVAYHHQ